MRNHVFLVDFDPLVYFSTNKAIFVEVIVVSANKKDVLIYSFNTFDL